MLTSQPYNPPRSSGDSPRPLAQPRSLPPPRGTAVGEDLPYHVAPGNPGDPAASVCRRAGLIEALHRRAQVRVACRRARVEHLPYRQLAMEDVAADQAVLPLHEVRPDDLPVQHRGGEPGRDGV